MARQRIKVQGKEITLYSQNEQDYISLTDIAAKFDQEAPAVLIRNWLRLKDTIEFLGTWEQLNNPQFKLIEFDQFMNEAGSNRFTLSSTKWIEATNAIGIESKRGRGGGTYAHRDIALQFCYWLSPPFQLYFIKEFQALKEKEASLIGEQWNVNRYLSKVNYKIHTEAVRESLVPIIDWNTRREGLFFAVEADLLNEIVFGMTAKQWRQQNPDVSGNLRDQASTEQLQLLANLEALNADYLVDGLSRDERRAKLEKAADKQLPIIEAEIHRKLKKG